MKFIENFKRRQVSDKQKPLLLTMAQCNAVIVFAAMSYALLFIVGLEKMHQWAFIEWLINYNTGFIRRGLPGTVILWMHENYAADVARIIYIIACALFASVLYLVLSPVYRMRSRLPFLVTAIVVFIPSGALMPIYDIGSYGRKEYFFLILLFLHVLLINRTVSNAQPVPATDLARIRSYKFWALLLFTVVGIPVALSHESLLFIGLPVNILLSFIILRMVFDWKKSVLNTFVIYAPVFITSMFLVLGLALPSVSDERAYLICLPFDYLKKLNCENLPGLFGFLAQTPRAAMQAVLDHVFFQWETALSWFLVITFNLGMTIYSIGKIIAYRCHNLNTSSKPSSIRFIIVFLGIPIICSLPLYFVTLDWGRWFSIVILSSIIVALWLNDAFLQRVMVSARIDNGLQVFSGWTLYARPSFRAISWVTVLGIAFSAYVLLFTYFPHCCLEEERKFEVFYQGLLYHVFVLFKQIVYSILHEAGFV